MKNEIYKIPALLVLMGAFSLGAAQIVHAEEEAFEKPRALHLPEAEEVVLGVNLEGALGDGNFLDPVSLSPDLYYGINDKFVVAVVHSLASQGLIGAGRSLVLNEGDVYNSGGLEVFYRLLGASSFKLALQGGFFIDAFDPDVWASMKLGGLIEMSLGPLDLRINPYMRFPLNKSDIRSNDVIVPVWLYFAVNRKLDFVVISGLNDEALQLGAGVNFKVGGPLDVGASLGWPRLAGDNSAGDEMAFNLNAVFAL